MEAYLYEKLEKESVRCVLCSHRCMIKPGKQGLCHVRENRAGVLHTNVYGKLIARHVDPIEKKPLFHVHPGSLSYSIATVGCNFRCRFCQNADIAQMPLEQNGRVVGDSVSPGAGCPGCSRTRNAKPLPTPTPSRRSIMSLRMKQQNWPMPKGILNVFVSNGYMTAEAIRMIGPYLDAANIDLKSFDDQFYKSYCSARLEPVKETLVQMKSQGVFVEVTTLIIPGLNDGRQELESLASFLVESLGPETPWHISRFHPTYKLMDRPVTPVETLRGQGRSDWRQGSSMCTPAMCPVRPRRAPSAQAVGSCS